MLSAKQFTAVLHIPFGPARDDPELVSVPVASSVPLDTARSSGNQVTC